MSTKEYRCSVIIDVEESNPEAAAKIAWDLLTGRLPLIEVKSWDETEHVVVDLERQETHKIDPSEVYIDVN